MTESSLKGGGDFRWLKDQIAALFAVFPASAQLTPQAFAARVLAYVEDLAEYPQDIAAEAIREARRRAQTFCPSTKDIRDIADRLRAARAPKVPYKPPELPDPPPGGYCTPEQAEAVLKRYKRMPRGDGEMSQTEFERRKAQMLAEFDAYMQAKGYNWPPSYDELPGKVAGGT